ncbi:hypothetical protein BDFB_007396 [Asbolus verrucosus]|uniref:C2H2-type domain-containing protein n=1 Tax=Asbolus verrucosus TaxID=1661398 RepID=A0A482VN63_ASBVE|nr:hypothetical protein BDFB_007396 [Asbolus verrucosus]
MKQKYDLKKHVRRRHPEREIEFDSIYKDLAVSELERIFRCGRCPKSYKNPETLQRHLKYECGIEPQFICAICSRKFKRKFHLSRHMLSQHDYQSRWSTSALFPPVATCHATVTIFRYVLGEEEGRYWCQVCGKSYKHYPSLWRHLKRECGKDFKFACDYCGVKFMQEKALLKHEYACRNCWKTYAKKSTMARHMKYECGKMPMFGCSKCPYRGYQKTHVERHLSRKHNVLLKSDIIRAIVTPFTDVLCVEEDTRLPDRCGDTRNTNVKKNLLSLAPNVLTKPNTKLACSSIC